MRTCVLTQQRVESGTHSQRGYMYKVTYKIDGKAYEHTMVYDTSHIETTLKRRVKTAFPNATDIAVAEVPNK